MGPKKQQKSDTIRTIKCTYYDRGFCIFGDKCNNKHPDKVCDDPNCSEENCDKRHPNPCKFGIRCNFNRKQICLYSHVTFASDDTKINALTNKFTKKFESLESKIKEMQVSLKNKDTEIKDIKEKHDVLEASFKKLQEGNRDL